MKTYQAITSAATLDTAIPYTETLLGIRFKNVKKNRYSAPCPFHADTKDSFMAYVNRKDELRFHCFGACKGDWDVVDLIMLGKNLRFLSAQKAWAEHLGIANFKFEAGSSPSIPEPDETLEPDEQVVFVKPMKLHPKSDVILEEVADFYNGLLLLNDNRFKHVWDFLARHGVGKDAIKKFKIGYAPQYGDEQYQGRALIDGFLQRFEKDNETFDAFTDAGLARLLNDTGVKGYGYYCRQIDFRRNNPFSRNYGDSLAGRIVFPIYDADARPAGLVGRCPGEKGVRWLKQQAREVPLSDRGWLYGLEKARRNIRHYRTIILVEGIFDYFAFYNLLQDQDKTVVVSTLGSYVSPEAAAILKGLDIEHFIVAFNWDELGRNGIERMAAKSSGWVYYLGGLALDQAPYDMLKPVVSAISGFSLKPYNGRCTGKQ